KKGEEVWHLSVHSFTPQLKGETRNADIGLLYDPSRKMEKKISADFKRLLQEEIPALKIRYNYPYLGKADGFTTYLRKKFPKQYAGIELEVNQKFTENNRFPKGLKSAVLRSVREILENK
ncbi:MAG: N-formylglutamate amidohydrolase, partial [Salegentibacter sp.]